MWIRNKHLKNYSQPFSGTGSSRWLMNQHKKKDVNASNNHRNIKIYNSDYIEALEISMCKDKLNSVKARNLW